MRTNYEVKFGEDNEVIFVLENDYLCKEDNKRCIYVTDKELDYLLALLIEKYNIAARNELFHKVPVEPELVSLKTKVINLFVEGDLL